MVECGSQFRVEGLPVVFLHRRRLAPSSIAARKPGAVASFAGASGMLVLSSFGRGRAPSHGCSSVYAAPMKMQLQGAVALLAFETIGESLSSLLIKNK